MSQQDSLLAKLIRFCLENKLIVSLFVVFFITWGVIVAPFDWQISFLGSMNFPKITPYIGFRWSRTDYIHWVNNERNRKRSDLSKSIGILIGGDIKINESSWINVEGQFIDAKAFSFGLNYSF